MKKRLKKVKTENEELEGIGGWLILPIIGMFFSMIIILLEISEVMAYPNDYLGYEYILMMDFALLILIAITLFQIFNKKKNAPRWAIVVLITFGITNLISLNIAWVIGNVIWIFYFIKSERVKNTFNK